MSLRWYLKILSAFFLVIAVGLVPITLYLGSSLSQFLLAQKEGELKRELKLAGQMIADSLETSPGDSNRIQLLIKKVESVLQKRVTVISLDGRVLGDSGLTPEAVDKMDDHSQRPEILAAKAAGYGQSVRFSTTLQSNTLYGAIPFYQKNRQAGYVRLALPLHQVEDLVAGLRRNLILAGGMTGLLAVLVSFFLTWSINRPLREISEMMKRMADGDLKQPFHLLPKKEFKDLSSALETMANELNEKMDLLDIETSQMTTLLSTMREGVLLTDEKGRIILMNPFLQKVVGQKVFWKKRTIQEIFMNNEFQDAVDSVLKEDSFMELPLVIGRTPQMHFEVQVAALTPAQRPRGAVALFHDTTKLQYLLKVRQEFVTNASHELRTPLTSINGYIETLLSLAPPEPPEIQRFLAIIQKNVKRMNSLLADLLDLAKLGSKEAAGLHLKNIPVKEVLFQVYQMVKDQTLEKAIALTLETEKLPEETTAFWEKDRIIQALFNVLDNAVKYTPTGGRIRLTAILISDFRFRISEPGNGDLYRTASQSEFRNPQSAIQISIEDTGIGIPPEHLPRIFERFYRVDKARSRELGGTGLGLSIVKHIVEAHGGTIQVQSVFNQGTIFTILLPLSFPIRSSL